MRLIKVYIIGLLALCGAIRLKAQQVNDSIFRQSTLQSFQLIDPVGQKPARLNSTGAGDQLLLFVFISPECPLCQAYSPFLNALSLQYQQTVQTMGIIPGRSYTNADVQAFIKKYKTGFPLLIDKKKQLTNYLQASITPEVVLLNDQFELIYRGAVDNSVKQLGGVKNLHPTEKYLEDAINKYLQHTSIALKRVKAVGCRINDF